MANHGAAALILIASLLVAVALSGADARLTAVHPRRNAAVVRVVPFRRDANNGGYAVQEKAVPKLTCNKVVGVLAGQTCSSVAQGSGLSQDDFLSFNPNINCDQIFVGQWVCLAATAA